MRNEFTIVICTINDCKFNFDQHCTRGEITIEEAPMTGGARCIDYIMHIKGDSDGQQMEDN